MALKESEAIVLRTYPMREADLLVTLFTRLDGKVRGVARSAKKSRRRFGGALEPLTLVRAVYEDRERQELLRLDSCEVVDSPLTHEMSYPRVVALGHVAELLDEVLPDREINDALFRLTVVILEALRGPDVWLPLTYFELWLTRLTGFLPDLAACVECGLDLEGEPAFYHGLVDGLMCVDHKRLASSRLSVDSRRWAVQMFRAPVAALSAEPWPKSVGEDLRKFLMQIVQRHLEKKLTTQPMLAKLD